MKQKILLLGMISLLTVAFLGISGAVNAEAVQKPAVVTLATGESWVVSQTTELARLIIGDNATITAPDGYSLTMTVNGVGTAIKAGVYTGRIVLTVTENINVKYNDMGLNTTYRFRTGVYVADGAVVPAKSVAAITQPGYITDSAAVNVQITSREEKFNGIMVTGNSKYAIRNPKIALTGNGGNDFVGFGAAIMSTDTAQVTVDRALIKNQGCVRGAVFVGGNSTMQVNDSELEVQNGTLPSDYAGGPLGNGGVMMEVPWVLGLKGNNRATIVVGNGTAYYNRCRLKAQAWGVLSTDAVQNVKLYATNCQIKTVESGYGAYADGNSLDTFSGCQFDVTDYGLIMTNGSGIFTDGCLVNSGRFGVMVHSGGSGTLTVNGRSVFNTEKAVIQVKSSYPTIVVDHAELHAKNGVILQAMVNDDPKANSGMGGGARQIKAAFSNTRLKGDLVTSMTTLGELNVTLQNTQLQGAITTATAKSVGVIDEAHYTNIGEITQTYCATNDQYGVTVTLDATSKWLVNQTSYLTGLTIAEGAVVAAPGGGSLTMTVDGVATAIKAGTYAGKIILTVSGSGN